MLWANQVTRFINKLWYIKMKSINHCFFFCMQISIDKWNHSNLKVWLSSRVA